MDTFLHTGLTGILGIIAGAGIIIASVVAVFRKFGWLQQLLSLAVRFWRWIRKPSVSQGIKQSVKIRDAEKAKVYTVGGDFGWDSRQVNSLIRTLSREWDKLASRWRQPDQESKNRAARRSRRIVTKSGEGASKDGASSQGGDDVDAERMTGSPGAASTDLGSPAVAGRDIAHHESASTGTSGDSEASADAVRPRVVLGQEAAGHEVRVSEEITERFLFDDQLVPATEPIAYPSITDLMPESPSVQRPPINESGFRESTDQHGGEPATTSVAANIIENEGDHSNSDLMRSPDALDEQGMEVEGHDVQFAPGTLDDVAIATQPAESAQATVLEGFSESGTLADAQSYVGAMDDPSSIGDDNNAALMDSVDSSARPQPMLPNYGVDEEAIHTLLQEYSVKDLGTVLWARRIAIGLSAKDINYDQGWVEQLEAGIWPDVPDVPGVEAALARRIGRYLEVMGWQVQDLRRILAGENERADPEFED